MLEDLEQFIPEGVCLSCDGCCRFQEARSSWRPKAAGDEKSFKEIDEDGYFTTVECDGKIRCVFFREENNKCDVYVRRPFECRLYPFLLIKKGNDVSVGVHLSCPYIQEQWQEKGFKEHVEILRKYFQGEEVLDHIRRDLCPIGHYAGCADEIEHLFTLAL